MIICFGDCELSQFLGLFNYVANIKKKYIKKILISSDKDFLFNNHILFCFYHFKFYSSVKCSAFIRVVGSGRIRFS